MPELIHVAVGVVVGADGSVLIARRPAAVHQGGLWEFPGGKLEAGESVLTALQRELLEELDIAIDPAHCFPLKKISHRYDDLQVLLDVWRVDRITGTPRGLQGQPWRWCPVDQLDAAQFPVANRAIVNLLQLPPLIAISGPCQSSEQFLEKLSAVLRRGINLVQFRYPELSPEVFRSWAGEALQLCDQHHARLLVNCQPDRFAQIPAHGLHVTSKILMGLEIRPVARELLFSASCHSLAELAKAEHLEADLALLSPVQATTSHPQAEPLGWTRFQQLASQVSLPVYALGGLDEADLPRALRAGAHGIAALSAFWR